MNRDCENIKVSIVVPLYYGKRYIDGLLKMVKENQSYIDINRYKIELELIFINDCDESVEQYIPQDTILVENGVNKGTHLSRVIGLEKASGQYILFLDQDDLITEDYVVSQISHIGSADAVMCNGYYRNNKKIFAKAPNIDSNWMIEHSSLIRSPGQLIIKKTSIPNEWRKQIIKVSGADDMFLWILMGAYNENININPNCLFTHVENGDNASFDWEKQMYSLKELYGYIKENELLLGAFFNKCEKRILKCINKFEEYAELEKKWREINENNMCFKSYFAEYNIEKIAIYGCGVIGIKLFEELKKQKIEVEYFIDKDAGYYGKGINVYKPTDELNRVDAIIVTPIFAYDAIYNIMIKKNVGKILSLEYIFDSMMK